MNMPKKGTKRTYSQLFMRIPLKEKILLVKQLAVLMRSGMPLFSSLHTLQKQTKSKTMRAILGHVIGDVENGQYLGTALSKFKNIFGELTIHIISVGEISGSLSENLEHLALALKKQQALKRKIIGASVYPIFVVFATIAITIMLMVFFFPKVIPVLKSVNYQLPWTTRFLIFASNAIKSHGILITLSALAIIIAIALLLKVHRVRFWYDSALLHLPFIKNIVQNYNTTSICRTLGLLQNSGVGIVKAFAITAQTTSNVAYRHELEKISKELAKGEKISNELAKSKNFFPHMAIQMIAVGESTGKLRETFLYLSDMYEEEMDEITKNLSTVVEPLLLVFMGILVGFVAISIITPIYGITQHLKVR